MTKLQLECPAAEEIHPVNSPNELDVHCRASILKEGAQGLVRNAEGSKCVVGGCYTSCKIWKAEKAKIWENKDHQVKDANRSPSYD